MRFYLFLTISLFSIAVRAQQPAVDCGPYENCLYTSERNYGFERSTRQVSYTDILGMTRTINYTLRIPIGRSGPLPVALWAHGGGEGRAGATASIGALSAWAELGAEAGYLSVAPAFSSREDEDRVALCQYLEYPEGEPCDRFSTVGWDRPFDMRAVLDDLERLNQSGPLQGRIDMGRIGITGHSAGSTGVLTVGGAGRMFRNKRFDSSVLGDPRPRAVIGLSVGGPATHGLFDRGFSDNLSSWETIDRPTMMITGAGDAHENAPNLRRLAFEYLSPGDKYRLWIRDTAFGHSAYGDDVETCGELVPRRKCDAFGALMRSTVFAFLDAYVQELPRARAYLDQDIVTRLPGNLLEWTKK